MSTSQSVTFESTQKPGKSTSQVFWLRIMNDIVRPRFLKVKEKQENQCMQMDTFQKFYDCYQYQAARLEEDTVQMEFFSRKFDKCVQEGRRALYSLKRVEQICSNKIINVIKEQTSVRRNKQKEARQASIQVERKILQPSIESNIQQKSAAKAPSGPTITVQNDGKYLNGVKLTWQELKSLENTPLSQKK